MKYIKDIKEGDRLNGIYMCRFKQSATTKNGKIYDNVTLQDKTGTLECKVWDPNSNGIGDFEAMDYVEVNGEVITFAGSLQANIRRARVAREGEYEPADYLPVSSRNEAQMWQEMTDYIASIKNPWLNRLLNMYFTNEKFAARFRKSSAAKTVHHGFVGGLLEHTLSVAELCEGYCKRYPYLNRDLLITAALLHDMGKVKEISEFPANDYTDDGQLLGHITMGAEMVHDAAIRIEGFPRKLESELKHCILAHHGEYEFGSPKKPALAEAVALNLADNTDAKLEMLKELLTNTEEKGWLGFNRFLDSNIRKTSETTGVTHAE